jgi:ferric-dicitrate binding protein FerR (iron transport regulator)
MTEHRDSSKEERCAQSLAGLLRDAAPDVADKDRTQTEWQRLLFATHREDEAHFRRPRLRKVWLIAPVAAGAILLAVGLLGRSRPDSSLRFHVDGRDFSQSYLSADATQTRRVYFSDGSELMLLPSGHMRISSTHAQGASLSLERGQLDLSIRHRPTTRWQLDAGPFIVRVTGTRFNVSWDPDRGDFSVALSEGAVNVSGPGLSMPITLDAGQELQAKATGNYSIKQQPETPSTNPVLPTIPEPQGIDPMVAPAKGKRVAIATAPMQGKNTCDWMGLVSTGQFETIVSQAHLLGIQTALAECPTRNLFVLADAARYLGNFELSRRTLLAISKRSPDDAVKADFFLGRLVYCKIKSLRK